MCDVEENKKGIYEKEIRGSRRQRDTKVGEKRMEK